jgi:hypothetical protein
MSTPIPPELPTYVQNEDDLNYTDELNQTLRQWLSSSGLGNPNLTTAQITILGNDVTVPLGTLFFNTDLAKGQIKTAAGTIETITSV